MPPVADAAARRSVELTVVRGFVALRGFDLCQALVAVITGSLATATNPALDGFLLVVVVVESILLGGWMLRRGSVLPVRWPVAVDLALSLVTISLSTFYISPHERVSVWAMWAYPLGLSTVSLIGAGITRTSWIFGSAAVLAGCYLAVAAVPLGHDGSATSTAVANALAFPGFAFVANMFMRFIRRLADRADTATQRVAELERDRSRAVVHNLLPLLRLERFHDADEDTRRVMLGQAKATYEHLRSYVDGGRYIDGLDACVGSALDLHRGLATQITVDTADAVVVDQEVLEHLHRALDTALANVEQHAPDAAVTVRVTATGDQVVAIVKDDGPGFDAVFARPGFGIAEILGRQLATVGGTGEINSSPGGGTEVRIMVPGGRR